MKMPLWTLIVPLVSLPLAAAALAWPPEAALATLCALGLCVSVLAAVHHAEVVAHRVGEPFGTLILAVSVTVIEVALIVSMMLAGGEGASGLARDTIFSAVMITCNGAVGLCVIAGGLKHHEQSFRLEGATSALAALIVLATLSLVLPVFTTTAPGPDLFSTSQLAFAAVSSLALWAVFVFVQTVRHRDYFLPPDRPGDESAHAPLPSTRMTWASFGLLIVSLLAVIGLAKTLSPTIERAIASAGLPPTVIGIVIAMLVLAPETWAALRAARADRLQNSLNLALGSALASIGLTIPTVAILSIALDRPLRLGLAPKDLVLLALTFAVGAITLGTGRTNVLQGAVHLLIFAAFLFLAIVP
jgi:Ca2+:H+ antiporter